ncbi:hypothetical protein CLAIMM_03509 [Cladophialophora immunda]|nr:hypothetical protein CLAIMM_03509 [Cladophialophora immunda]
MNYFRPRTVRIRTGTSTTFRPRPAFVRWSAFHSAKSRQISRSCPDGPFKKSRIVLETALVGTGSLLLLNLPLRRAHAEAPPGGTLEKQHGGGHIHGHDKRLVPHPAPVTVKHVVHDTTGHLADVYAQLEHESLDIAKLPIEEAILTSAPDVPPSITRDHPVVLKVNLTTAIKKTQLTGAYKYEQWTFNDQVPGPFIRARVGDVVELTLSNKDETGMPHNIDSHAFLGPGGGSAITTTELGQSKTARFKLLCPGLFVYHCAAGPVPVHIANGMFGLMYVQPAAGDLPPVDKEYYVMQSEWYHEPPEVTDDGRRASEVEFSYPNALREEPEAVFFNGKESALTRDRPLKANVNDTVRIFFGNAGPNLTSAFHVIGGNFRRAYRDGDVLSPPGQFVSTLSVPPGGATIVDMHMLVPGTMTLVDHAIFRLDKGAVGYLNVSGKPRPDVYQSVQPPAPCPGCKLHP